MKFSEDTNAGNNVIQSYHENGININGREFASSLVVGNRHLGYHTRLKRLFGHCEVMASNPKWNQSLDGWKRYFSDWIREPEKSAVMHSPSATGP